METATAENTCADENRGKKEGNHMSVVFCNALLSHHTHYYTLPHTTTHTHQHTLLLCFTHTHTARVWDRSAPSPFKEGLPVPPQTKVIFIDKHFAIFEGLFAAVVVVIVFYGCLSRRYEDRLHAKHKPCHHTHM